MVGKGLGEGVEHASMRLARRGHTIASVITPTTWRHNFGKIVQTQFLGGK